MEQVVEYQEVKTVGDIVKTFASIPVMPIEKDGKVEFSIMNFPVFIDTLKRITAEYNADFIVNKDNVGTYEKEAAEIKKLSDKIAKDAKAYVDQFAVSLLGVTRGKAKKDGQVQIAQNILMNAYEKIHQRTEMVRAEIKAEKDEANVIEAEVIADTPSAPVAKYEVEIPLSAKASFEAYLSENHIKFKEVK